MNVLYETLVWYVNMRNKMVKYCLQSLRKKSFLNMSTKFINTHNKLQKRTKNNLIRKKEWFIVIQFHKGETGKVCQRQWMLHHLTIKKRFYYKWQRIIQT